MDSKWDYDAVVVGAGPNGLAAAIRLAQMGLSTLLLEANEEPGGACRTEELTVSGFWHDVGSAVHPLAVASPFFSSLPLQEKGLRWLHPEVPLAHPINADVAVALKRSLSETAAALGRDAVSYIRLFKPLTAAYSDLLEEFLQPILHIPRYPFRAARFGAQAILSARRLVRNQFREEATRALLGGLSAHSFLSLSSPGSAAFALLLGMLGHAVGWPLPYGGARSLTEALVKHLVSLGGKIQTGTAVTSLKQLPRARVILLDITPRQFVRLAEDRLPPGYLRRLTRFKYGPGVVKIDYALDRPLPWIHEICHRSGTIHIGGTFEAIAEAEAEVARGKCPEWPFLLVCQPTLFDPTRAPAGMQIAWVYCHVPNGSTFDMTARIERQIDRFAPGFRAHIIARRTSLPGDLERQNPNLIGGAITGGANNLWHMIARPILSPVPYRTPLQGTFLCSSSTPPGGGVHGMCGLHAANAALRFLAEKRRISNCDSGSSVVRH